MAKKIASKEYYFTLLMRLWVWGVEFTAVIFSK